MAGHHPDRTSTKSELGRGEREFRSWQKPSSRGGVQTSFRLRLGVSAKKFRRILHHEGAGPFNDRWLCPPLTQPPRGALSSDSCRGRLRRRCPCFGWRAWPRRGRRRLRGRCPLRAACSVTSREALPNARHRLVLWSPACSPAARSEECFYRYKEKFSLFMHLPKILSNRSVLCPSGLLLDLWRPYGRLAAFGPHGMRFLVSSGDSCCEDWWTSLPEVRW
jgi:hypothetical protein